MFLFCSYDFIPCNASWYYVRRNLPLRKAKVVVGWTSDKICQNNVIEF
jgi:hypothetical protein